jgi:hypothetical protein
MLLGYQFRMLQNMEAIFLRMFIAEDSILQKIVRQRMVGLTHCPSCQQQARGSGGLCVTERAEGGMNDLLVRLRCARNYCAREFRGQALGHPFFGEQRKVATGHVNDAGGIFQRWQRRAIVRLGVMAT